jgi:two-component system, NarL family, nitrate/nitrite response regulator NarL
MPLTKPAVVIVDMETGHRLDLARLIHERAPAVRVVAFGVEEVEDDVLACAAAGRAGYVPFDASIAELAERVGCVTRGEFLCPPRIAAELFRKLQGRTAPAPESQHLLSLTTRERDVLRLIDSDFSNKEIAQRLQMEVRAVRRPEA